MLDKNHYTSGLLIRYSGESGLVQSSLLRNVDIDNCLLKRMDFIRFFCGESNISVVPKQQGTVLFPENGSIYPKTV
jgi:hypothetical protein